MSHPGYTDPQDPYGRRADGLPDGYGQRPYPAQPPYAAQPQYAAQPPMYVDAYGRPVYPAPQPQPTPPGNPALGIWSSILAAAGTVVCLVGFIWAVGQIDAAVKAQRVDGQDMWAAFIGGFGLMQTVGGFALLAALVMGIVATATNRGRGWGIGGIVGSVVGPMIVGYLGALWIGQKALEWSDVVRSSIGA